MMATSFVFMIYSATAISLKHLALLYIIYCSTEENFMSFKQKEAKNQLLKKPFSSSGLWKQTILIKSYQPFSLLNTLKRIITFSFLLSKKEFQKFFILETFVNMRHQINMVCGIFCKL